MNIKIKIIFISIFSISFLFGYNQFNFLDKSNINFNSYNTELDSSENKNSQIEEGVKEKNQFLAMGLSAIIPGTGQIYYGQWKRGVAYLGLELILWSYRKKYNDKGDHYVVLYKQYADQHWSFKNWVKNYYSFMDSNDPVNSAMINEQDCGNNGYCDPWVQAHKIEWHENGTYRNTTEQSGGVQDLFIDQCGTNYDDGTCSGGNDNVDFNNLHVIKDHHFYEGIGKYNLYFAGWDDVSCSPQEGCRWTDSKNGYNVALTQHKLYYQDVLRAKSNEKYDYAENALTAIFVNHAVSMFDILIANILRKKKEGLKFYSEPLYDLNYSGELEGIKFNLKW